MIKKFSKFLLVVLITFIISSYSFVCLADENHEHTDTETTTQTTEEETTTSDDTTSTEEETHNGDLYLFDNDIIMDKLVNGNVFIFGNNVEITGRVNGNLFVFANNVTFNESIVRYSIFICANSVYYNGGCGSYSDYGNLYIAAKTFEATYDAYVTGDIKAVASDIILKAAIYRDADLLCNNVNFGESSDIPVIYGNLRYTAKSEATIPEGVMLGDGSVTYTKPYEMNNTTYSIPDILIGFATCIITVLVIYLIIKKLIPGFAEKISNQNFSAIRLIKAFGIGLASIVIVSILFIVLLMTAVGTELAFILGLLFVVLCLVAVPTLAISITNVLKPALKLEKTSMFYLVLILVSIILYGITLMPYVGTLLGFIIKVIAIGLIFLPHKELSDEEKTVLEEKQKLAKENKEKRKQERLEVKAAKKQEKLEAKEAKKNNKEI